MRWRSWKRKSPLREVGLNAAAETRLSASRWRGRGVPHSCQRTRAAEPCRHRQRSLPTGPFFRRPSARSRRRLRGGRHVGESEEPVSGSSGRLRPGRAGEPAGRGGRHAASSVPSLPPRCAIGVARRVGGPAGTNMGAREPHPGRRASHSPSGPRSLPVAPRGRRRRQLHFVPGLALRRAAADRRERDEQHRDVARYALERRRLPRRVRLLRRRFVPALLVGVPADRRGGAAAGDARSDVHPNDPVPAAVRDGRLRSERLATAAGAEHAERRPAM